MTDDHSEADIVFETVDDSNLPVVLSRTTWQAKAGNAEPGEHPEVREYLEDVRLTIEKPDVVFQSTRDPRPRLFYKLSVGRGRFAGKHLVVVVKYVGMDIRGRPTSTSEIYGELVIDDVQIEKKTLGDLEPDAFGFLVGEGGGSVQ